MKQIFLNVGGRPGIDCGGFCKFCFFRKVNPKEVDDIERGCVNCPPQEIGCDYCQNIVTGVKNPFKPLKSLIRELQIKLIQNSYHAITNNLEIVVHADADIFCYPQIMELVTLIKQTQLPYILGYTGGKSIKNISFAEDLISQGLKELTFSVFSTNPEIRGEWMRDKNPETSLQALQFFCRNIEVNASVVVVPDVNDGEEFNRTCQDLEEWGIKTLILRRFGNSIDQGLIFNKQGNIVNNINTQTYEEFQELVEEVTKQYSFQVTSFPFYDPQKDFPFAILHKKNRKFLDALPEIKKKATIITGKLAEPSLKKMFKLIDDNNMVNVISVNKDIADLIIPEDLKSIDLSEIEGDVVLPRGALVHQLQARKILGGDGVMRNIKRGPYHLTHPYYENLYFTQKQLIDYEFNSFKELVEIINQ